MYIGNSCCVPNRRVLLLALLLVAAAAGSSTASAQAAVRVTARAVTVTAPGGSVVLTRSPLAIAIRDARGRTVLRSTTGARVLGGVSYSALGVSAGGSEPELAWPVLAGHPDINPKLTPSPVRHAATRVLGVARLAGGGARIRLATETGGPVIAVDVASGRAGTLSLKVTAPGAGAVWASFASPAREAFHGFGGRREGTDLRGSNFQNWVLDYRYPDATTGYYAPQPSFVSSSGYGLLLDTPTIARWRLDSDTASAWRVSTGGTSLAMRVAPGPAARAIGTVTSITGRHRVPPAWSTGPTLSRTIGVTTDGDGRYRARVEADVAHIEAKHPKISAYAFEGWAGLPRAFVVDVVRRLHMLGIHSVLYLRSFVAEDAAGTEAPGTYATAIAKGYVARNATGVPYLFPSPFPGAQAAVVDFTSPAARAWWATRVRDLLDTGADGFMNDFGEQVLPDMHFASGETGATLHNRFPALQAKVTRAAVTVWEHDHPGRQVSFFQRAGYAGSAAYENAEFPGDETVDWTRSTGLPSIVPDMLNRAVGGAPGFDTDIGGYAQFTPEHPFLPATNAELFTRWAQAAALMPYFRVHNSGLSGAQMPWDFDAATEAGWEQMAALHQRAAPLMRRLWRTFVRTGVPMERPLWLADPGLRAGTHADDEWMVGKDLLAAPVLSQGATSRAVALPSGCWRLHGAGLRLSGQRTITVAAPLASLPWFARCGTTPLSR